MPRQSSAAVSRIAANMLTREKREGLNGETLERERRYIFVEDYNALLKDAKKLAGSVLSQDETKGQE